VLLRFENQFFDDHRTVDRVAAVFPSVLRAGESLRIFNGLSRGAIDAFIADLDKLRTVVRQLRAKWVFGGGIYAGRRCR